MRRAAQLDLLTQDDRRAWHPDDDQALEELQLLLRTKYSSATAGIAAAERVRVLREQHPNAWSSLPDNLKRREDELRGRIERWRNAVSARRGAP